MRFFDFFRLNRRDDSANKAKERLTVLVALDRTGGGGPDFLPLLQRELLEVIRKYVDVDQEKVNVDFQAGTGFSTYLASFASYSVTYGSMASVVIALIFFYITSIILVLGAYVNAAIMGIGRR